MRKETGKMSEIHGVGAWLVVGVGAFLFFWNTCRVNAYSVLATPHSVPTAMKCRANWHAHFSDDTKTEGGWNVVIPLLLLPFCPGPFPSGYLTDLSLFLHQCPPSALSSLYTAISRVQASSLMQLLGHIPHRHLHADSVFFKQIGSCLFFWKILPHCLWVEYGFQGSYCILILSIQFVPLPPKCQFLFAPVPSLGYFLHLKCSF